MAWLGWERLFSMLCMDGSSLNLGLMLFGNYVVIMIVLMSIYIYMYVCMYVVSDKGIMDHDFFMLMFIYMYVSMHLFHCLRRL